MFQDSLLGREGTPGPERGPARWTRSLVSQALLSKGGGGSSSPSVLSSSPTILSPQCEREGPWEEAIPGPPPPPQVSSDQGLEAAKCLMSSCGHSKSGHFVPPERPRWRKPALRPQAGEHPPVTAVPVTGSRAIHNQSAGPKSFRGSGEASGGEGVCIWPGVWVGGWGRGDLHGVTAGPAGQLRDTWRPASVPRVRSRTPEWGQDVGWGPALQPGGPHWPGWPDLSNEDA